MNHVFLYKFYNVVKISPERQGLKIIRNDPKNPIRLNDESKDLTSYDVKENDILFKFNIYKYISLI